MSVNARPCVTKKKMIYVFENKIHRAALTILRNKTFC